MSDFESKFIWDYFDPQVFKGVDVIISCGDLKASYLSYLVTMIPAPLYKSAAITTKAFTRIRRRAVSILRAGLFSTRVTE